MAEKIEFHSENRAGRPFYRLRLGLQLLLALPKTVYFNFRCFPAATAVRLPVLVSAGTRLIELRRGAISFACAPRTFLVKIGFGGSDGIAAHRGSVCLEGGEICFAGKATFAAGASLRSSGQVRVGENFFANKNCTLWCSERVSLGRDVLFGWNVTVRDSDGHLILVNGAPRPVKKPIEIGDHCWIGAECHLLKGAGMGSDSVLGYGSILTKAFPGEHLLLAGTPARELRNDIDWVRGE